MKTFVMVLFILFGLASCATGPVYTKVAAMPDDKALIYFYRPSGFAGAVLSPAIYDGGKLILSGLPNGGYWFYFADVGVHTFTTDTTMNFDRTLTVDCPRPGEAHFIRMDMLVTFPVGTVRLNYVPQGYADSEIVNCRLIDGRQP